MAEIDAFATNLLEEAKRFFELAKKAGDEVGEKAFLHASLLLGMCALEAHVNAVAEEMSNLPELSLHEKGLLLEKDVVLDKGDFMLTARLKMSKLEERIEFLFKRFKQEIDKQSGWWPNLQVALALRNGLSHPKVATEITRDQCKVALEAILETISALYLAVYKMDYPFNNMKLHSQLSF